MTYGSDGTGHRDYSPESPDEQEPYYGDAQRRQPPPRSYRPEPYDPFQTRAHDEQAAERQRQAQAQGQGQAQQRGQGHHHGQHGRSRDPYGQGDVTRTQPMQQPPSQQPQEQQYYDQRAYGNDYRGNDYGPQAYNQDAHGQDGYRGQGQRGDGYGGNGQRGDAYGQGPDGYGADDRYGADPRAQGRRGRAADRLGATSLLEEDPYAPQPGSRGGAPDGVNPDADGDGEGTDGTGGRSGRRKGKKVVPPHVRRRRKIIFRSILAVFLLIIGYVGITIYPYLTAPGTDRLNARVAEWGRDHHLGWAVTWLENATYKPPPTGGGLNSSQLAQLQGATPSAPPPKVKEDLPTNIVPLAAGKVPGEGVWHPVTMNSAGVPIVEKAALRPDAQHTSDLAYVVWMNQKALNFTLHPGYQQPGGTWQVPDSIPAADRANLVATWNGGFKIKPDDALAGFYAEGKTVEPLVNGKAAEVFYKDGSIKIGSWGRDETMGPNIAAVRQNLSPLVDQGQVTVGPGDGSSQQWGYTIKNSYFIARSGVGMTATGDIVYVSGRFLSVYTLAELLKSAGAVSAMELDINPDWVSFMSYAPSSDPANPTITKLWDFTQPGNRYFQPSDRDFVSVGKR